MKISTFLEKPQRAPITTPTVMLMSAHMNASDTEMRAPFHMASNVDSPDAPAPRIQWIFEPNFAMAAEGVKCLAAGSSRLANRS